MKGKQGVTESERLWKSIDANTKATNNLCGRVASIETYIKTTEQNRTRNNLTVIGIITVAVTVVNLAANYAQF